MKLFNISKIRFSIYCIFACLSLTLTACDDPEDTPQEVTLTPVSTSIMSLEDMQQDSLLNETSAETNQPLDEPKTAENLEVQPIEEIADKPISSDDNTLAVSLSRGLATGFNYQLANNQQWTQSEKDCFGRINNNFAVAELDKIIKTELNEDEFQQASKFYQSSAGKQLEQWRDTHLDKVVKNNNISVNDMNFAENDLVEIAEFNGSSANIKINQLLQNPQIEKLISQKIAPQLLACGMIDN